MQWNETDYAGWGGALRARGRIARPEKLSSLSELVSEGAAPAIGARRSYGDGALNTGGSVFDMTRLNRFLDFDPDTGVLSAEAGVTIAEILAVFAPKGWMPAVMPGTGFATLGGCIANDVHGKNHHIDGGFGSFVDSIELMAPDGRSKRISRTRNKDLFRATLGGLGQTGIILSARIRLIPCETGYMQVQERRIETLGAFLDALNNSTARFCVGWIDATATGASLGRGILEEAEIADTYTSTLDSGGHGKARSVPFNAPSFALSPMIVRLFNRLYRARVPHSGRRTTRTLSDFFFPLDRLKNWNRLYGKSGFHQFQCVVPTDQAEAALGQILTLVAKSRRASPLVVIKKLGAEGDGMLSFPMPGVTLALDIRNSGDVQALFDQMEQITVAGGGRLYAAKDSLASAEGFASGYPELGKFRDITNAIDPDRDLSTDLTRRLQIRGDAT